MPLLADVSYLANAQAGVPQTLGWVNPILGYLGTIAFAISGALVAARRNMDPVGVIVLGCMVAVGGGTIRDVVLNVPVFWVAHPAFVALAAVVALVTVPLTNRGLLPAADSHNIINMTDAAGMALFAVTGTSIALEHNANWFAAAILGVISGVGGGMIRDVLANKIPDVLRNGQFYATAAFLGALAYVALLQLPVNALFVVWVPLVLIFGIRMFSLSKGWGLPAVKLKGVPVEPQ